MSFNHGVIPGQTINNEGLASIFLCAPQGGMRRSHRTNSLVLISDHTKSLYEDRWEDDIFHYTGMGKIGHQRIDFQQNKTLAESNDNVVEVYLFEVFRETEYVFIGQVELAQEPYQEEQLDEENNLRLVWIFPLKLISGETPVEIPKELIEAKIKGRERKATKLTYEELKARAKHASKKAAKRKTSTTTFERDPYVTEYAKRWAKGLCQLCDKPAPFKNKKGEPFLHTHHIDWLSRGGQDSIDNTVGICPNCHEKMHVLDLKEDVLKLKEKVKTHIRSGFLSV